jgi:hypothetical protein
MYPHVLLKIENDVPNLYLVKDEDTQTKITLVDQNLAAVIIKAANTLGIDNLGNIEDVLATVNHADENYLDENPDINPESVEFELDEVSKQVLELAMAVPSEYADIEMSDEVRAELETNHKHDILASIVNILYKVLITKTLIAAHDLELDKVHFFGDKNYARLTEKMGKELTALGVELFLD